MSQKLDRGAPKKRRRPPQFVIYIDDEDRAALEAASRIEKLTRSEIVRRALRAYYRKLQAEQQIAS